MNLSHKPLFKHIFLSPIKTSSLTRVLHYYSAFFRVEPSLCYPPYSCVSFEKKRRRKNMSRFFGFFFVGLTLMLVGVANAMANSSNKFDQLFQPSWAFDHFIHERDLLKLKLDKFSGKSPFFVSFFFHPQNLITSLLLVMIIDPLH